MTRRTSLHTLATGAAAAAVSRLATTTATAAEATTTATARFRHSVCRWCFGKFPLDELCRQVKPLGIASIELLGPGDWPTLREHGLSCALAAVGERNGIGGITRAFNRTAHHDTLAELYAEQIPLAAKAGVPNVIAFSGNRDGLDDEQGLANCVAGLKRIAPLAEKHEVTITIELLNSRVDHPDYQCDHTEWGAAIIEQVGSERVKLLYDIYHMQVMEGDVIATIRRHRDKIAHFHTAGVPGRHEIDDSQELNYRGIARAIADLGFDGFVAQEFVPTAADPLDSLRRAIEVCTV
jgi:hydroxypyruvate isomerase